MGQVCDANESAVAEIAEGDLCARRDEAYFGILAFGAREREHGENHTRTKLRLTQLYKIIEYQIDFHKRRRDDGGSATLLPRKLVKIHAPLP